MSLSAFLLACCGCGTNVPDDLRNLVPVTITVTDGSQPVLGIQVTLISRSGSNLFACNGITDASGVAMIQSSRSTFVGKGAPAGTYTVVLLQHFDLPPELESLESDSAAVQRDKERKREEFYRQNRVVPEPLASTATSPVELVVEKPRTAIEIDISKYRTP
jgi:hypothetical protein